MKQKCDNEIDARLIQINPTKTTMYKKSDVQKKFAIVVGAGPSGLVFAKHALDNNIEPIILEKQKELGGFGTQIQVLYGII